MQNAPGQEGAWGGQQQQGQQGSEEMKTLWIGDLQYWMDENYLWTAFSQTGEVQSAKVIRNKTTGQSEGYGFLEFANHAAAERVLQTYNGHPMPQTEQPFRLNWASFGIGERRPEGGNEHSIFVGDLANDVTDYVLTETFRNQFPSVKGAKVVTDSVTGRSKGYGFVRFGSEEERDRALSEMNGQYCSNRPMRISVATPKKPMPGGGGRGPPSQQQYGSPNAGDSDPSNTTVFVGGLDPAIGEDQLRQVFSAYGETIYVKIPYGKGCGFVQFGNRASAEAALQGVHGTVIGTQSVRLSWGRNPSSKQRGPPGGGGGYHQQQQHQMPDPNAYHQQAQGYYGYGQGYDQYGQQQPVYNYGMPPPEQAYAGYGQYAPPQHAAPQGAPHGGYPQQQQQQQTPAQQQQQPAWSGPNGLQARCYSDGSHYQGADGSGREQHRAEPVFDPRAPPDVNRMNTAYMAAHEPGMQAQHKYRNQS
eukprot:jgi/Mesen1/3689/ME000202S02775